MSPYGERIVRVETEVTELKAAFQEHKDDTQENFREINRKLDDLLAFRNKGAGVIIFLGGIVSFVIAALSYLKWK